MTSSLGGAELLSIFLRMPVVLDPSPPAVLGAAAKRFKKVFEPGGYTFRERRPLAGNRLKLNWRSTSVLAAGQPGER
jgi:hypothetical protein